MTFADGAVKQGMFQNNVYVGNDEYSFCEEENKSIENEKPIPPLEKERISLINKMYPKPPKQKLKTIKNTIDKS